MKSKIDNGTIDFQRNCRIRIDVVKSSFPERRKKIIMYVRKRVKAHPLTGLIGKTKEVGAMEKWKDEMTGIGAHQYAGQVDFVQIVKLKGNIKTSVSGSLTYQVCTNEMCLPPKTDNLVVQLTE